MLSKNFSLTLIGVAACILSSCRIYSDGIYAQSSSMIIWASKNKTLLKANNYSTDSVTYIQLELIKGENLDLSLLKSEIRNKVKLLNCIGKNSYMPLSYFPNTEYFNYYLKKRNAIIQVDSSIPNYTSLKGITVGADSIYITELPNTIERLSIRSKYLSFPYIHNRSLMALSIESDIFKINYRNFGNIRSLGNVYIISQQAICIDSLSSSLKTDSLNSVVLFSKMPMDCRIQNSKMPYIKSFSISDSYLQNGNCTGKINSPIIGIRVTSADFKNFKKEKYADCFLPLAVIHVSPDRYRAKPLKERIKERRRVY
jgi:hypothetical protein